MPINIIFLVVLMIESMKIDIPIRTGQSSSLADISVSYLFSIEESLSGYSDVY